MGSSFAIVLISSSVSVSFRLVLSSMGCSSDSDITGAVLKLSCDREVSGVLRSGSVVGSLHNSGRLNGSKLDKAVDRPPGSSITLLDRGSGSSSSSGDGLSLSINPKKFLLLGGVLFLGYLAS